MIDYNNFDFDSEKLSIEKLKELPNNALLYSIKYDNNIISFPINNVKTPFGLEKYYNDYIIKIQLSEHKLKKFIYNLEDYISNINKNNFKSQIKKNSNFDDLLTIKISNNKNDISIKSSNSSLITIFDIKKKSSLNCIIFMDLIWTNSNNVVAKFKTNNITLIE
mgnify:CR=1 FL=1